MTVLSYLVKSCFDIWLLKIKPNEIFLTGRPSLMIRILCGAKRWSYACYCVTAVLVECNAPSRKAKWKVELRSQPLLLPVAGGWGDLLITLPRSVWCKPRSSHSGDFRVSLGSCSVLLIFSVINAATVKDVFCKYVHQRNHGIARPCCVCVLHKLRESFSRCRRTAYHALLEAGRESGSSSTVSGEGHTVLCRQRKPSGDACPAVSVSPEVFSSKHEPSVL